MIDHCESDDEMYDDYQDQIESNAISPPETIASSALSILTDENNKVDHVVFDSKLSHPGSYIRLENCDIWKGTKPLPQWFLMSSGIDTSNTAYLFNPPTIDGTAYSYVDEVLQGTGVDTFSLKVALVAGVLKGCDGTGHCTWIKTDNWTSGDVETEEDSVTIGLCWDPDVPFNFNDRLHFKTQDEFRTIAKQNKWSLNPLVAREMST